MHMISILPPSATVLSNQHGRYGGYDNVPDAQCDSQQCKRRVLLLILVVSWLSRLSNNVNVDVTAAAHPLDDAAASLSQPLHQQSVQRQLLLLLLMLRMRHPLDYDTAGLFAQCTLRLAMAKSITFSWD